MSSTFEDLKRHRKAVLDALASLQQRVEAMEYWGPSSSTPQELSLKKLNNSLLYIGIIGARYGTIISGEKSITELEYEKATELGLERLIYLIDENYPVPLKYHEQGQNYDKLSNFKLGLSHHVRATFTTPSDLARQVITHLVKWLTESDFNIGKPSLKDFSIKSGYSFGMDDSTIDFSTFLLSNDNGELELQDEYIETVIASSILAKNIHAGNYEILDNVVAFKPKVTNITAFLLKDLGFDKDLLEDQIRQCTDAIKLRLLISLAGKLSAYSCADVICHKLLSSLKYERKIKEVDFPITPFNDIVKISLSEMPRHKIENIVNDYIEKAKTLKKWQAKRTFEKVLKTIMPSR